MKSVYNFRRNIQYRRILLQFNSKFNAYQNKHYGAVFVEISIKSWPKESGVLIIRNVDILSLSIENSEHIDIIKSYKELHILWLDSKNPCSLNDCQLCKKLKFENDNEKIEKGGKSDDDEEEDENEAEMRKEKRKEEKEKEDKGKSQDKKSGKDKDKKVENVDRNQRKSQNAKDKQHAFSGHYDTLYRIHRLLPGHRKIRFHRSSRRSNQQRKKHRFKLYDDCIPYTHRPGYTWAGSTSNELMIMWQAYRTPERKE